MYQIHYLKSSIAIVPGKGVSLALECGVSTEIIKTQMDSAGNDCKNYVNPSLGMCHGILQQVWEIMWITY